MIRSQYGALRSAWRDGVRSETWCAAWAFVLLGVLAFCLCVWSRPLREWAISLVLATMDGLSVTNEDGSLSAMALLANNLRACTMVMLYGLIPFLYLPAMALGINSMLLGVLAGWYLSEGVSLAAYAAALVPHGIFELPALVLSFAVGLYLCGQLSRRCRGDREALPLRGCLLLICRTLALVELPLLIAAAWTEAYVTPLVASHFF